MNIVIIGAGEVGRHLARFLDKEAHRVTVVDHDPRRLRQVSDIADVQAVCGDAANDRVLEKAGIGKADLLVAVTDRDELNMLVSLVGKRLGARRTVVRVHASGHLLERQMFYKDTLGFDLTISPEQMSGLEIMRICRVHNPLPVETFAGGRLQMRRLDIKADSPALERPLADLKMPKGALVTMVIRGRDALIPRGSFLMESGDVAVSLGLPEALDKMEAVLGRHQSLPKRVIAVGSSNLTVIVARFLMPLGIRVKIIESDEETAGRIATDLPDADVVHGDPTSKDLLKEEGIDGTDFFLALGWKGATPDEWNMVACQLAKSLGAQRTVAIVERPDFAALTESLSIDHAVSPRRLVARRIAAFVRSGGRASIASIHHGAAEVLDHAVSADWVYAGEAVKRIPFPEGSIVGAIVRDTETLIPKGDTVLRAGDHLLIFAVTAAIEHVERLFQLCGDEAGPPERP